MEKKIMKKLLAIVMIITILSADFFVLGSNLRTYAAQINSETNNSNIEFSAYFKNEANERIDSIEKSIKNEELKLYAEIKVKNNGYLNGSIEIENSNFNIKEEILPSNTHISSIEGNKINLRQINAGETVEFELGIVPIILDKMPVDMLSKVSTVKLKGMYLEATYEGIEINAEKTVCVNYKPDENINVEAVSSIITNQIVSVNEENKKIVQVLVKSRIKDNEYPIEQTTINVVIPQLSKNIEEISVMSLGKLATNGLSQISESDYTINEDMVQIVLKNEVDANNEIKWEKNCYDEIVVTFVYPETVEMSEISSTVENEIKLYGKTETYKKVMMNMLNVNTKPNNIVMGKTEIKTEELYKGKLYANIDEEYETETKLIVTKEGVVEEIKIEEGPDAFVTEEGELPINTKYVETELNLNKMLEIFGEQGNIEIKNGEKITIINKDTTVNENGNIIIDHGDGASTLEITTSVPVKAGVLEIRHKKLITGNEYTRKQLQEVKTLISKTSIVGTKVVEKEKKEVVPKTTGTATLELKETISKAELKIENNKQILSATEANEVTLGVTLVTDAEKYDLYKNPTLTLQLPSVVENVEFISEPSKINANEFEIISKNYDSTNKTIKLNIKGEQTSYAQSSATQAYFQLSLKITLSELTIAHNDVITLTYTNENATQYYNNGSIQQQVAISAPSKVITKFNLKTNENTSLTETFLQRIENNQLGTTLDFEMVVINNKDTAINNVRILGKLPTKGNNIIGQDENTLETTLKNITAPDAQVYYTENIDATDDIEDETNAWTRDLTSLSNAKLYLIKLSTLNKGETYSASMNIQLPQTMDESGISYTEYEVIYDTATEIDLKENSRAIGLATSLAACIKPEIIAQVGNDLITNGDIVKEGEVVKYTIIITNKGNEVLKDIKLEANVPEGTVLVRPIPRTEQTTEEGEGNGSGYVYAENAYYEEITDSEKIAEITNSTITELAPNQTYSNQYEVRVNKGAAGTEISNIATVECDGSKVQSIELKNKIKEANIRVTIKRTIDESIQILPGGNTRYTVYVENLSESTINDLEMQIISDVFKAQRVENDKTFIYDQNGIENVSIKELKANEIIYFSIYGNIQDDVRSIDTTIIVRDSNGEEYRSNSFAEMIPLTEATINITSPQNNKNIKEGDIVKYNITIKNTGDIEGTATIKDRIPRYLSVQSVSVDGVITRQCTDSTNTETYVETIVNNFSENVELKVGQEVEIEIIAKVGYISEQEHGKVITNYATVEMFQILEDSSEKITHILQSSSVEDDVKNVISGIAWFDKNANGQKDEDEEVLSGINVKLFDLSKNNYMTYESGTPVVTRTDDNGEYSFIKIKNGSYLVIFEYDMNKYEHTVSFAEGVDTSINSKVILKNITVNGETTQVAAIELLELEQNSFNMNIGLKEGNGDLPPEEQPGQPGEPGTPDNPDQPGTPDNPDQPDQPDEPEEDRTISGVAWLDVNRNGKKDSNESTLSGIVVKIYDVSTKNYLVDDQGNIVQVATDANGKYTFSKIHDGEYILVYQYDTEKYEPTIYLAEGVDTTVNSKVVLKNININGQEITTAVTDKIYVTGDVFNINIGLKENLIFDLELNKYISKIVVQTIKGTKTYNSENETFEKIEIQRKQLQGALVVLEYTIKVKNTGEIAGSARSIVDYLPNGLTFTSELNKDWYLSGNNLYTKALENVEINPGEEKEIKLILTKTMTNDNTGLINNRAEICQDYNKFGDADTDSTPNNQVQDEDDFGAADVIILVATGGGTIAYTTLLMINTVLIGIAIRLMIKNRIITIPTKKKRR